MARLSQPQSEVTTPGGVPAIRQSPPQQKFGKTTFRAPLNIFAYQDRYEVHADLPGSSRDAIEATIEDGVLRIAAAVPDRQDDAVALHTEYGVGDFWREIRLGEDIDTEAMTASYEAGVLKVVLPKRPERRARRIEIAGG